MIDFAQVTNHRFTKVSKALQLQVLGAHSNDMVSQDTGFADAFGSWALIAIPDKPTTDAQGKITSCAEAIVIEYGNEHVILGTRDVRMAKYAQDLKPGEVALVNSDGFRLFLGRKKGAFVVGGGFLSFDAEKKSVGLVGIPSSPGGSAPYISISPTILGLVSATGQCSVTLSGANVSINAAAVAIAAGRIDLGKDASDPVVTQSQLEAFKTQLMAQFNAHAHVTGGPVPLVPMLIVTTPGRHVFAPTGG